MSILTADRCSRCGRKHRNMVLHGLRELLCTRCWFQSRRVAALKVAA